MKRRACEVAISSHNHALKHPIIIAANEFYRRVDCSPSLPSSLGSSYSYAVEILVDGAILQKKAAKGLFKVIMFICELLLLIKKTEIISSISFDGRWLRNDP